MREILSGLLVAFGLYSALPLPQIEWKKSTMRYALCFLPLIGVLVGICQLGWLRLAQLLDVNGMLYAAGAVLVPIALTGGIHLDGFVDTCDALCSYGDREKRLNILKDPHVGAFGVLWLIVLLIGQFGLFAQLYDAPACGVLLGVGYALARVFGGYMIVSQKCAKDSGLAHMFADGADKRAVAVVMYGWMLVCAAALVLAGGWFGALTAALMVIFFVWHIGRCKRTFGGITGDLCGMCITVCETIALVTAAIGGLLLR